MPSEFTNVERVRPMRFASAFSAAQSLLAAADMFGDDDAGVVPD